MTTHAATVDASSPEALVRLGTAFCDAKILLSALELDVFSTLAVKPLSGDELSAAIGLHPRGAQDFVAALVTLGLLEVEGDTYRNAPATERFLDRAKPGYAGGFLERANNMLYPAWTNLTDALRTGEAQVSSKDGDIVAQMGDDPEHLRQFLAMMDALNSQVAPKLARAFDWAERTDFVDVGGARGNLSALLIAEHPHLRGHVFDLPHCAPEFDAHMVKLGTGDRIGFTGGNFFEDSLPKGQVLVMGHVLHNWDTEQRIGLIAKAYEAVEPGGALLVYDRMVDEQPKDLVNLLISLDMLLVTHGGAEYSATDCAAWMKSAGFSRTETKVLSATDTVVIGHKEK